MRKSRNGLLDQNIWSAKIQGFEALRRMIYQNSKD